MAQCPKCGAARPADASSCPECGVIYDKFDPVKYQELLKARERARNMAKGLPEAASYRHSPESEFGAGFGGADSRATAPARVDKFAQQLREQTLYPNFRGLVSVFYVVVMLFAAFILFGAFLAVLTGGSTLARVSGFLAGSLTALTIAVFAKVCRELGLMLADMSDAAVYTAARMRD